MKAQLRISVRLAIGATRKSRDKLVAVGFKSPRLMTYIKKHHTYKTPKKIKSE